MHYIGLGTLLYLLLIIGVCELLDFKNKHKNKNPAAGTAERVSKYRGQRYSVKYY